MLLPALIAAVVSGIALRLLGRAGGLPFDRPNARSLHRGIVPRGGGLAIWLGWCAGIVWLPGAQPWLLPLAAIVIVSFFDDRRGIPALLRLFVQLAAAIAWLWLAAPMPDFIVAATMAVAIVWVANLYNFMDGSDGLAGAMAVVGFGAYARGCFLGWKRPCADLASRSRPRRSRFCWPTGRRRDVPGRRRRGAAGLSRRGVRHRGLSAGMVAGVVSAARFPAVHRRCHADALRAALARRAALGSAPRAISTSGCISSARATRGTLAVYASR